MGLRLLMNVLVPSTLTHWPPFQQRSRFGSEQPTLSVSMEPENRLKLFSKRLFLTVLKQKSSGLWAPNPNGSPVTFQRRVPSSHWLSKPIPVAAAVATRRKAGIRHQSPFRSGESPAEERTEPAIVVGSYPSGMESRSQGYRFDAAGQGIAGLSLFGASLRRNHLHGRSTTEEDHEYGRSQEVRPRSSHSPGHFQAVLDRPEDEQVSRMVQ